MLALAFLARGIEGLDKIRKGRRTALVEMGFMMISFRLIAFYAKIIVVSV